MNNILLRSLTGGIFVSTIIAAIWFSPFYTFALFTVFIGFGLLEYYHFFDSNESISIQKFSLVFYGLFSFTTIALIQLGISPLFFISILFPVGFLVMLAELWRKKENPLLNIASLFMGVIYLVIPFYFMLDLAIVSSHESPFLIGMFLLIWTNDTFAYLSGRFFGKTKLFERISPNKTWEGTIGGIVFSLLVGFLIGNYYDTQNGLLFWMIAALIVAPCAIFGDLLESLFKRSAKVKDSGNILPGHGGILDRFDASLFAAPFFYTWWVIYPYI